MLVEKVITFARCDFCGKERQFLPGDVWKDVRHKAVFGWFLDCFWGKDFCSWGCMQKFLAREAESLREEGKIDSGKQ